MKKGITSMVVLIAFTVVLLFVSCGTKENSKESGSKVENQSSVLEFFREGFKGIRIVGSNIVLLRNPLTDITLNGEYVLKKQRKFAEVHCQ